MKVTYARAGNLEESVFHVDPRNAREMQRLTKYICVSCKEWDNRAYSVPRPTLLNKLFGQTEV